MGIVLAGIGKAFAGANGAKLIVTGVSLVSTLLTGWQSKRELNTAINDIIKDKKLEERIAALEAIVNATKGS